MSAASPEVLWLSLLLGVLLGLLFTVLDTVRLLLQPGRAVQLFLDLFFCFAACLTSFLLSLAVSAGYLRFFQAGSEILGFFSVYLSLTAAQRRLLHHLVRGARRLSLCLEARLNRVGKIFLQKNHSNRTANEKKREKVVNKAKKIEKST